MKCYFNDFCTADQAHCPACVRRIEYDSLIKLSCLPAGLQKYYTLVPDDIDLAAYEQLATIKNKILDFVQSGKNFYIFSTTPGNGKTAWTGKILKKYFSEVWPGNAFKCRGYFCYIPTFLQNLKDNITNKNDELPSIIAKLKTVDLVIFDDVGIGKLSDFELGILTPVIDERINNLKSCIFTSNLSAEKLSFAVGSRLKSRIYNNSEVIQLRGTDKRGACL